jgi:hypothetical protein
VTPPLTRASRASLGAGIGAFAFAAAAVACGAGPARRSAAAPEAPPEASARGALPDPAQALPTLDELAARGASTIARMHEIHRLPDAAARSFAIEPPNADTCYRAVVVASGPARAHFVDEARATRGEAASGAGAGPALVPPQGPACARRGERLSFVVEALADAGAPVAARAVLFQSP